MDNPGSVDRGSIYDCLVTTIQDLSEAAPMDVWYAALDAIPGSEILYSDRGRRLRSVGKVAPDEAVHEADLLCAYDWRARWDGQAILAERPGAAAGYRPGLWRYRRGEPVVRIADGLFKDAIVTPDGAWLIACQWQDRPPGENVLIFDLRSGGRRRVEIPGADDVFPVAFLPAQGKVLVAFCRRDPSRSALEDPPPPSSWPHCLLDPPTGAVTAVEGEFRPLHDQKGRPLQPTSRPDEAWAALPDPSDPSATAIGRYDAKAFAFRPVLRVPYLDFGSMDLWVDEAERAAYIVANGDLLRIPLPAE